MTPEERAAWIERRDDAADLLGRERLSCPDCKHRLSRHGLTGDTEGMVSCVDCRNAGMICDRRAE